MKPLSPPPAPGSIGIVAVYLVVVLAPLVLAWVSAPGGGGITAEIGSAVAFAGYAMLLAQFALTGRFRVIGGRVGIDVVLRLHQLLARALTILLVLHPFLYSLPRMVSDPAAYLGGVVGMFATPAFASGLTAWMLLLVLMVLAVYRSRIGLPYEAWRASHALLAVAVALGGLHHALSVGGLSGAPGVRFAWVALAGLAGFTLLHTYLFRPLALQRHPWRVADVRAVGPGRWVLTVEPDGGRPLRFRAGQFVWLKIGGHPFTLCENPFSIASAPDSTQVEFLIREAGDFTNAVGRLRPGQRAWLDGPHGAFTRAAAEGAGRIVLLAGGVGLAPCLGMLREAAAEGDPRPHHLIFGNRTEGQAVLRDDIGGLARTLDLRTDFVLSEPPPGWTGTTGQMDAGTLMPLLAQEGSAADSVYFLCGPPPMVRASLAALSALGVPADRIVTERFDYD
ncbi:MAG: ferric reductase-like transmembrane domain-containing protein [Alphaproteobacteria bacterium]